MGITIQQYRSRIGRFLPNLCKSTNIFGKNKVQPTVKLSVLTVSLLSLAIVTPFILAVLYPPVFQNSGQLSSQSLSASDIQNKIHCGNVLNFKIIYNLNTKADSNHSMISNLESRRVNGNRRGGGIEISHWNKGPGHLQNKMAEIKNVVNGLHPHILGISEANLYQSHDLNLVQIDDYVLHTCPTISNHQLNTSRIVVYTQVPGGEVKT